MSGPLEILGQLETRKINNDEGSKGSTYAPKEKGPVQKIKEGPTKDS